jgi:serine protease Do
MRGIQKKVTACLIAIVLANSAMTQFASAQPTRGIELLQAMSDAFAAIAEKASPAVVSIRVEMKAGAADTAQGISPFGTPGWPNDDFFRRFFGERQPQSQQRKGRSVPHILAQGSGFIVSKDGYIITSAHVVKDADKVTVRVADKSEVTAKVVGIDEESELAVIKIDAAKDLPVMPLGDSEKLRVGQWVLAIGNPFGLSHTVTVGIVSAKGRSDVGITTYEDFIQTDAAINPGNSGGPLVNLDGEAVGINTAIVGASSNVGIGLAIPANMAKSIYRQLVEKGKVVRGFMGVSIQDLTSGLAKSFGLPNDAKGALIAQVEKGSPADKAGLKQGDIVTALNGQPVTRANDLQYAIAMQKPGDTAKLTILRDKKEMNIDVVLAERSREMTARAAESSSAQELGITVKNMTPDAAEQLGYKDVTGVLVTKVEDGSLADMAGISPGFLIQEVNRRPVANVSEFGKALSQAIKQGQVLLLVYDGQSSRFVEITMSGG